MLADNNLMAFQMGMIIGGLVAGVVSGFMPLGAACRKGRYILGSVGFGLCILAGLAGGFLLALPLGVILSFCFSLVPKAAANLPTMESMGYANHNPYAGHQNAAMLQEAERALSAAN